MTLKGKPLFITGASRGIGRATALALGREGARVAVGDLDHEAAESVAAELGGKAKVVRLDFNKENAPLFERFGVRRLPTLAVFRDGEIVDQIFGAMTGGAKVGDRLASCVNLTTAQNIAQMVEGGA
jgi:NAD(P)-dependent dehydrogenase (short-subunit alcohol dehydrogenase family)